jgi:D-lactate dehydrogenase (cytochrome)
MIASRPRRSLSPACLVALRDLLGERVSTDESVRVQHGRDESSFAPAPSDAAVFPQSTDEVAATARLCAAHDVPMIPYGVASSLEGHALAVQGGVSIDLSRMNRSSRSTPKISMPSCKPAWPAKQLNEDLRDHRASLSARSGRGRDARRHVGDARLGHERGALRDDARERALAPRGAGGRRRDSRRHARLRKTASAYWTRAIEEVASVISSGA